MTYFERIKAMSVEELAVMLHTLICERENALLKQIAGHGLECSLVRLPPEVQLAIDVNWLESEVECDE